MKGLNWGNPLRIRSAALTAWVQEMPSFNNSRILLPHRSRSADQSASPSSSRSFA